MLLCVVLAGSTSTWRSQVDLLVAYHSNLARHFIKQLMRVQQQEKGVGMEASGEVALVLGDLRKATPALPAARRPRG